MVDTWSGIPETNQHLFAVYGKNLSVGRTVSHRSHRKVEAASTIKLLILAYLLHQVQAGVLSLSSRMQLESQDVTKGGSGMLQSMMPRQAIELSTLCLFMMGASDNAAANALLRLLGKNEINAYAQQIGLKHTQLLMSPIDFSQRRREEFRMGVTTASDMGLLLTLLLKGQLFDPALTQDAIGALESVQQSYIMRGIDIRPLQALGSKTGTLYNSRLDMVVLNECGFVVDRKGDTLVMCVFSQQSSKWPLPHSQDAPPRQEMVRVMSALYDALRG